MQTLDECVPFAINLMPNLAIRVLDFPYIALLYRPLLCLILGIKLQTRI